MRDVVEMSIGCVAYGLPVRHRELGLFPFALIEGEGCRARLDLSKGG